jgi:sulfate adenylyltransferase
MPRPHGGKLINRVLKGTDREKAAETAKDLPKVEVSRTLATDTQNIAKGIFSPLQGFMNQEELDNVLNRKRLPNDLPWTIPIVLDVAEEKAKTLKEGDNLALHYRNKLLALLNLEEKFNFNKEKFARKTYGTSDIAHPGVAKTKEMDEILLAGKIDLVNEIEGPYDRYKLSPMETRVLFKEKGWRTIVGFQTRNPPHLGHEYVQKTALAFVDGVFINPVIGRKKKGDFKDEVILEAYDVLIEHYYLKDRAVMSILPFEMRYAGPREAIFHAIVRKNFGCTHFIVGRDHAGVGSFYGPYEAQEIFEEFPDLGVAPLFFKSFFYCKKCGGVTNEKACPHDGKEHISFSGTKIRALFSEGEMPPKELMRPEVSQVITRHSNPFLE